MEALSFSFTFFKEVTVLVRRKRRRWKIHKIRRVLINKEISTIVDVDDKNCLAELTVVQKLNQGVRQWLYIIAGVLFFGSFFCTSKRKNINRSAF